MTVNRNNPDTLPVPGAAVTFHIPDGQPPIPVKVESVEEYPGEDGEGGIWLVTGQALVAGRYGFGDDAADYGEGDRIVVAVTSGDAWVGGPLDDILRGLHTRGVKATMTEDGNILGGETESGGYVMVSVHAGLTVVTVLTYDADGNVEGDDIAEYNPEDAAAAVDEVCLLVRGVA